MSVFSTNSKPVTGLAPRRGLAAFLALALLLFAASCGGSSLGLQDSLNNNVAPATPGASGGPIVAASGEMPSLPQDGSGVPARGASAVTTIPGSDAIMIANGEVVDTTLVLTSLETAPAPGQDLAWGLYQVSGLAGKKVTSLAVSAIPGTLGQSYSVGVSNFSEGVWQFLQTTSLPEFEYDLSDEESRLVSRLGNLYFIVVVSGGDSVTVVEASVLSEDDPTGGTGTPPALGGRPQASEGLSDRIVVTWDPIDGAESYELWRAKDTEGSDKQFSMVAEQAERTYTDTAIELGVEYKYKVRGVNSAGVGMFGPPDSGWAGTSAPAGEGEDFGEKEVFGTIQAIDASSLTVKDTVFAIDENTKWLGENGLPVDPAQFTEGTLVQVHGKSDGADGWIATSVRLEEFQEGQESEVKGNIEAISDTEIVVNGQTYMVNESTEWLDNDENPLDPSNFTVGTFVEVDAVSDGNGGWIAQKVKLEDQGGGEDQHHSENGAIQALDGTTITVNGVVFSYDESTQWLDNNGNPLTPADFSVGMFVEVEGIDDGNGGWLAQTVQMDDQGGGGEGTFETGNIQALDDSTITVNDVVFSYDENTEWLDQDNNPLTPADFSVGMFVKVEADPDGSGGWLAYKVKMEDQGGDQSHDELGNIQALTDTTITVNDVVFTITDQTEWLGLDNEPLTPADFSVGELVKVEGTVSGEDIIADKVKKED